jgi:hypothetical protein
MQTRQAEIDGQICSLEELQADWECQKCDAQRKLDDRTAELDQRQAELDALKQELEEVRESLAADRAALASRPAEAPLPPEANIPREDLSSTDSQLASESTAAPPEAAAEPVTAQAKNGAVDLADILRRTGYSADLSDDDADTTDRPVERRGNPSAKEVTPTNITSPAPRSEGETRVRAEDDVSIDDYMSRLLARNRTDSPVARPAASTEAAPRPIRKDNDAKPDPLAAPSTAAPKTSEPLDFGPRATAPERNVDLNAMRQLANFSAKSAINTHDSKRLGVTSKIKLAVSLASAVVGIGLTVLSFSGGVHLVTMLLGFAAFAVAAYCGGNYIALTKQIMGKRMHWERHLKADGEPSGGSAEDKSQQAQEATVPEQEATAAEGAASP